jgi:serine/threonine protein kinase
MANRQSHKGILNALKVFEKLTKEARIENEKLRQFETFQSTVVTAPLHSGRRFKTTNLHKSNTKPRHDDETEVTADETASDPNDSFSLSSSCHSTSHYPKRHCVFPMQLVEDDDRSCSSSSSMHELLDENFPPDITEWNILRILGEGEFGQVVQVARKTHTDRGNNRSYALKMLSKYQILCDDRMSDIVAEKMLLCEAGSHPFIVNLRAAWQDADSIYILQDFLQGGELYSLMLNNDDACHSVASPCQLVRRAFPEHQAQFYAACIADALNHLHSICRIVYRDLKPENVLLDSNGYPVLIDLGLAKRLSVDNEYETRTLCGTPHYVAPEQIEGTGHSFGVDHWALAVLTYEMLTGLHPYDEWDGTDNFALYDSIALNDYLPIASEGILVSAKVRDWIDQILVKDPKKRLGSCIQPSSCRSGLQTHEWLSSIDVAALRCHKIRAPWKPELKNDHDAGHFDDWESTASGMSKLFVNQKSAPSLTAREQAMFKAFDDA